MRHPADQPTPRELEVAEFLAQGFDYTCIAQTLNMSAITARNHVHSLYRKLNVSSVQALIAVLFVLERRPDFPWPAGGPPAPVGDLGQELLASARGRLVVSR